MFKKAWKQLRDDQKIFGIGLIVLAVLQVFGVLLGQYLDKL